MPKKILALILAIFMAALELALGRLDRDQFIDYILYLLGVAEHRELFFDADERLDGEPGQPALAGEPS